MGKVTTNSLPTVSLFNGLSLRWNGCQLALKNWGVQLGKPVYIGRVRIFEWDNTPAGWSLSLMNVGINDAMDRVINAFIKDCCNA